MQRNVDLLFLLKSSSSVLLVLVLGLVLREFYVFAPPTGDLLGKFSSKWAFAFLSWVFICGITSLFALFTIWMPGKLPPIRRMIQARESLGHFRWAGTFLIASLPVFVLLFIPWGSRLSGPFTRLSILFATGLVSAVFLTRNQEKLVHPTYLFFGFLLIGSVYHFAGHLIRTTNYPFSLTWSEGNRLYDYSVQLGGDRYLYPEKVSIPYQAPGRYFLWGILFAIPGTPIWLHRLWDAILWTVPQFALAFQLARWGKLDRIQTWIFTFWAFLFLAQGPIMPPLVIAALLIITFISSRNLSVTLFAIAIASYYASSSRWTWLLAGPTWGAVILLFELGMERFKSPLDRYLIRRYFQVGIVFLTGLAAGSLANPKLLSPQRLSTDITFSQPLLWYRLFPNATYSEGILLGLVVATVPLVVILAWLVVSRRWKLPGLSILIFIGVGGAFAGLGVTASVKIGGGTNLHNLDLFLITLAIFAGLSIKKMKEFSTTRWPAPAIGLLMLVLTLPAWQALRQGAPLRLPSGSETVSALQVVDTKVHNAQKRGDVLFIDQRQLLAFGMIEDIRLVQEYEKKYLMDQAMAGNVRYFQNFYQDLSKKRFSMIVSEPLFVNVIKTDLGFREENNVWVEWVAAPVLCYYAPVLTLPEIRVQLLVPRAKPEGCPE